MCVFVLVLFTPILHPDVGQGGLGDHLGQVIDRPPRQLGRPTCNVAHSTSTGHQQARLILCGVGATWCAVCLHMCVWVCTLLEHSKQKTLHKCHVCGVCVCVLTANIYRLEGCGCLSEDPTQLTHPRVRNSRITTTCHQTIGSQLNHHTRSNSLTI